MRIDEFSDMAASGVGLSPTERVRFICFGFDMASAAAVAAIFETVLLSGSFGHSALLAGDISSRTLACIGAFGYKVDLSGRLN